MASPAVLPRKPEARTEKVEDLVERVRRGLIRIPDFQRLLKWKSEHVAALFDSVYRGFPIGSLLFYLRKAPADRLEIGPLVIDAPEVSEAWWVVDGQQRLAAFAACLLRPLPLPAKADRRDPFALYFDAVGHSFESPPATGRVPSSWVPVPHLLSASRLSEWIFSWVHRDDEALRTAVFDAGARIREYLIPLYLIEGADWKAAREIFTRTNLSGVPLRWDEVHKALFAAESSVPSTLDELSDELAQVGMGRLAKERLLTCLMSLRGLDPTRSLDEHRRRNPACLEGAVQEALPVLRSVLSFLRSDAGIPHLRLLPMSVLLDVITRFFAVHFDPKPRTRILLARWFWRTVVGAGAFDERTTRRQGIAAVDESEERSAQRLLDLLFREPPRPRELPKAFDARSDDNRIVLLTLVHLGPRSLLDGHLLDVPALLEKDGKDAFVKILRKSSTPAGRSPANRLIQPRRTPALRLLRHQASLHQGRDPILASHAVDEQAVGRLLAGDEEGFLTRRQEVLAEEVRRLTDRLAAWEHKDRPSIDFLLREAGAGA
jgi:hypothetical protein